MDNKSFLEDVSKAINDWCLGIEKYMKKKKKITARNFLNYMLELGTGGYSTAIIRSGGPIVTSSSFCDFRKKIPFEEFRDLCSTANMILKKHNIVKMNSIYAIDGSKILVDKGLIEKGYKPQTKVEYSQALINTALDLVTGIPIDTEFVSNKSERDYIKNATIFEKGSIFVADRGYYSFDLVRLLKERGMFAVFRMPVTKEVKLFKKMKSVDETFQVRMKKRELQLRIVKYTIADETYFIGTNIFDKVNYPVEKLRDLYHSRWQIEEHYKFLKCNTGFKYIHSKFENGIKQEMYLNFFITQIVRGLEYMNMRSFLPQKKGRRKKFNSKVHFSAVSIAVKNSEKTPMNKFLKTILPRFTLSFELNRSFDRLIKFPSTKEKYNDRFSKRKRGIKH